MQKRGYDRKDQIRLQSHRLSQDVLFRFLGGTLAYAIAAAFLPLWIVSLSFSGFCLSEVLLSTSLRRINARYSEAILVWVLFLSTAGVANFALMPLLLWTHSEPLQSFIAVVAILGAMLSTSVVRSIYLPMGLWNLTPAALVFLWMPLQAAAADGWAVYGLIATLAAVVFTAYLLSLTFLFNRSHAELVQARQNSETAAQTTSRLFSAMSHEMRTPLQAIIGLNNSQSGGNRLIQDQATRLLGMLEDALDIAPRDIESRRAFPATAALSPTLNRALTTLPVAGHETTPHPRLIMTADTPAHVRLDADYLCRAVRQLCVWLQSQPTLAGNPTPLVLHCSFRQSPTQTLCLRFSYDGPAPAGRTPSLSSMTDSLSFQIAEQAAEALSALITFAPGTNAQTDTILEVPCQTLAKMPPPNAAGASLPLTALVVDDIGTNRLILVQMLKSLGIQASEAASGTDAVAQLRKTGFDVVLLDMNMPGMDGAATFQAIRALASPAKDVPVLALTADAQPEQRRHCFGLGFDDFLTKPVDAPLLWAAIAAALPAWRTGTGPDGP